MIEAHLCLHPHQFGLDNAWSSFTPEQFKMVCEARDIHTLNS